MEAARAADGWLIHGCRSTARGRRAGLLLRPRRPDAYLAAERMLLGAAGRRGVDPGARGRAAGRRVLRGVPLRGGARDRCREDVERRRGRAGCSRCAGPTRSRSTRRSRCAPRPTRKQIGRTVAFSLAAFRQAYAGGRAARRRQRPDRGGGVRDAPARGAQGARAARGARGARDATAAARGARRARRPRGRRRRAGLPRRRRAVEPRPAPPRRPRPRHEGEGRLPAARGAATPSRSSTSPTARPCSCGIWRRAGCAGSRGRCGRT